jgi:TPR repeat protein
MRQATVCRQSVTATISIQTGRRRHWRAWFAEFASWAMPAMLIISILAILGTGTTHAANAAADTLMRQAQAGDRTAQMTIGDDFRQGADGLPKDDRQALIWYQKAAVQGHAPAQNWVAYYYEQGLAGLTKDDAQAVAR